MGKALCLHPSAHKSREGSPSEKPQGLRYSHHTLNHKKVLLETPCNDSPPIYTFLLGAFPCAGGWPGEPGLVEPEMWVSPGRKQWAEVVWKANSPTRASRSFTVPGGDPHCCLHGTHHGMRQTAATRCPMAWHGRAMVSLAGTTTSLTTPWTSALPAQCKAKCPGSAPACSPG